jgi:eukaryotic-like serine/threonine-protein kinase
MSSRPVPWLPLRPIGRGGRGEIWAARHTRTRAQAAVKIITPLRAEDESARVSLRNEVRAMARLSHPGIVRILDHGVVGQATDPAHVGLPCIVMEQIHGASLIPHLGRIPWPELRALLLQLLRALAHAHASGLIHRDLKPGNVLVPDDQGPRGAKLTDFGLTHPLHAGPDSGRPAAL